MKRLSFIFYSFILTQIGLSQDQVIPLWPNGVPGAIEDAYYVEFLDTDRPHRIRNVSLPTLSIYLPDGAARRNTAVVICPGGGYHRLAFDHEGFLVAEWLNQQGVAGFLLKYRLPSDQIMEDKSVGPLQDVQQAIRVVRRRAKEWDIDSQKIGVMGFSAGGHLAASASTLFDMPVYESVDSTSARPDFSILIYPVISFQDNITHMGSRINLIGESPTSQQIHQFSADEQVTAQTPPAFLVHTLDDGAVPVENTLRYVAALRSCGVPCEVHLYESGGHGFGIMGRGGSEMEWKEALKGWMQMHGWM